MFRQIMLAALFPVAVEAAMVECPARAPGHPFVNVSEGQPLLFGGAPLGGPSDVAIRRGDLWHEVQVYETFGSRDAELLCSYGRGKEIRIPIDGLLLRCDWLYRYVSAYKPPDTPPVIRFLRIWCTSRP